MSVMVSNASEQVSRWTPGWGLLWQPPLQRSRLQLWILALFLLFTDGVMWEQLKQTAANVATFQHAQNNNDLIDQLEWLSGVQTSSADGIIFSDHNHECQIWLFNPFVFCILMSNSAYVSLNQPISTNNTKLSTHSCQKDVFQGGQFDIAKPPVFNFIHFTDSGESGSCFMGTMFSGFPSNVLRLLCLNPLRY